MLSVYKYTLELTDVVEVAMPRGAQILHVEVQNGETQLWALVDPLAEKDVRRFRIAGTGHPIDEDVNLLRFVSTFTVYGGGLVFHVFEILG